MDRLVVLGDLHQMCSTAVFYVQRSVALASAKRNQHKNPIKNNKAAGYIHSAAFLLTIIKHRLSVNQYGKTDVFMFLLFLLCMPIRIFRVLEDPAAKDFPLCFQDLQKVLRFLKFFPDPQGKRKPEVRIRRISPL